MGSACGRNETAPMDVKIPIVNSYECYNIDSFKENEEELQNKGLICVICLGVIKEAVIDQCGHNFGYQCIKKWIKKNENCPFSRKSIKKQLKVDFDTRKLVLKLHPKDWNSQQLLKQEKDLYVILKQQKIERDERKLKEMKQKSELQMEKQACFS